MRTCLLIISLLLACTFHVSAQDGGVSFSHSLGAGFYFGRPTTAIGLVYSPRVNLLALGDEVSFSVGTHCAFLGGTLTGNSSNLTEETSSTDFSSYCVDLPLLCEFNFGNKNAPGSSSRRFGFFLGAGYGLHNSGSKKGRDMHTNGPVVNAGLRYGSGFDDGCFELRGQYMFDNASFFGNQGIAGLGLSYHF